MGLFRTNKKQVLLGVIFLLAGTLEYLIDRPIGSTYFLYQFKTIHSFFRNIPDLYGSLGMCAPSFFHVLAFSLISMSLFSSRKARISVCLAWFCLEFLFELGQKYGSQFAPYLPEWLEKAAIAENLKNFLINGTFDIYDLMAIGLGALTAFLIGELLSRKGENNERAHAKKMESKTLVYN
jgi:hypothetical protein